MKNISYSCAVHESRIQLSGVSIGSRDQNIHMGMKRRNCDWDHFQQFFNWFEIRNPFNMKNGNLYSLLTGVGSVHGDDSVNFVQAEIIDARVQQSFDDSKFTEIKMREKNPIFIKPTLLLAQLGTIEEREKNVEQYFNFEFTHRPEFLFKKKLMGKPDKAP